MAEEPTGADRAREPLLGKPCANEALVRQRPCNMSTGAATLAAHGFVTAVGGPTDWLDGTAAVLQRNI